MNVDKIQDQIYYWLKKRQNEFGVYEQGKFSAMLALATYGKIISIDDTFGGMNFDILKKSENEINTEFAGDLIQTAINWFHLKDIYNKNKDLKYENIISAIENFFNDSENKMDNIDRLFCCSLLNLEEDVVKLVISDSIMELSNVLYWKYVLVEQPIYYRKIHNSFHYSTPYILLYCLSKAQSAKSMLTISDEAILDTVISDGYKNFYRLSLLDAAFLLSATPIKHYSLLLNVIDEYISRIEREGLQNIPFYYDNVQFGKFIGADTYTAAVIFESLITAGKFKWKPFVANDNISRNFSISQNSYLENIDNFHHPKMCRMIMKEHCMAPFLDEDDEIDVSYDFSDIATNDIVVFRHYNGRTMAHRVIDIITKGRKSAIITAADNGGLWGYPVFKRDVVGKVVGIYKHE